MIHFHFPYRFPHLPKRFSDAGFIDTISGALDLDGAVTDPEKVYRLLRGRDWWGLEVEVNGTASYSFHREKLAGGPQTPCPGGKALITRFTEDTYSYNVSLTGIGSFKRRATVVDLESEGEFYSAFDCPYLDCPAGGFFVRSNMVGGRAALYTPVVHGGPVGGPVEPVWETCGQTDDSITVNRSNIDEGEACTQCDACTDTGDPCDDADLDEPTSDSGTHDYTGIVEAGGFGFFPIRDQETGRIVLVPSGGASFRFFHPEGGIIDVPTFHLQYAIFGSSAERSSWMASRPNSVVRDIFLPNIGITLLGAADNIDLSLDDETGVDPTCSASGAHTIETGNLSAELEVNFVEITSYGAKDSRCIPVLHHDHSGFTTPEVEYPF